MKMPLGMEVSLGPGDIVFDGYPGPPKKGRSTPSTFQPMSVVGKRWPISATAEHLVTFSVLRELQFLPFD